MGTEFLDFIVEELQPAIRDRYDVTDEGSTRFGSSLGGLFVFHTLFHRPDAFDNYLAVSPAIGWDERVVPRHEASYAESADDLDASLYLAVGSWRTDSPLPPPQGN